MIRRIAPADWGIAIVTASTLLAVATTIIAAKTQRRPACPSQNIRRLNGNARTDRGKGRPSIDLPIAELVARSLLLRPARATFILYTNYRLRWPRELAFKRINSHLRLSQGYEILPFLSHLS